MWVSFFMATPSINVFAMPEMLVGALAGDIREGLRLGSAVFHGLFAGNYG
jgi:hypothetical protein